jgi:DNA-binding GntR family transcriptional regulator
MLYRKVILKMAALGVTVLDDQERARDGVLTKSSGPLLSLDDGSPAQRVERITFTLDSKPAELPISMVAAREAQYISRLVG